MEHALQTMEQWYRSMPGAMLAEMEHSLVSRLLTHCFGDTLVQIGGQQDLMLTSASEIPRRIYIAPFTLGQTKHHAIQAKLDELPLAPSSADIIVCAHMLEFVDNPEVVIKEMYSTLKSNGQLIVFGFNPLSLWGMTRYRRGKRGYPWRGHFHAISQVKRWMRHAGFRVITAKTFCFRPAVTDKHRAHNLLFLEAVGQIICPGFGGAFMLIAHKREVGMTPLVAEWSDKKLSLNNRYAEPTTRVTVDE